MKQKKLDNLFKQAYIIAENSPDAQTKVGSLLVRKSDGAIISSGYNGFIRGAMDSKLPKTRPEKHKYIIHSEKNLIYHCARLGISMEDCFVVCTLSPCIECIKSLYQCGIDTVYFAEKYRDFPEQLERLDIKINLTKLPKYYKLKLEVKNYEDYITTKLTNGARRLFSDAYTKTRGFIKRRADRRTKRN
jgi:dCMP deaminase